MGNFEDWQRAVRLVGQISPYTMPAPPRQTTERAGRPIESDETAGGAHIAWLLVIVGMVIAIALLGAYLAFQFPVVLGFLLVALAIGGAALLGD